MTESITRVEPVESRNCRWGRGTVADKLIQFDQERSKRKSQREAAECLKVPRTTHQHWLKRKENLDASPAVIEFFESPDGLAFLHRLVIAVQFVILNMPNGGIRAVCLFLELSGVNSFVAGSFGKQQKVAVTMKHEMVSFGQQERNDLAVGMRPRLITSCNDETFHLETCFVAIEPISNYIFLEKYSPKRDAQTWAEHAKEALSGLPVTVIQVTSDEAKGLLRYARTELGVHHSPDLFHVLFEVGKGIHRVLSARIRQDQERHAGALQETQRLIKENLALKALPRQNPGKAKDLERAIQIATWHDIVTEEALEVSLSMKKCTLDAIQGISEAYHPFDLTTGTPRQAKQVEDLLDKQFAAIDRIAKEASLSDRSIQHVEKARRLIPSMLATITFFWHMVLMQLEELSLPTDVEFAMRHNLIPACYLMAVAKKTKTKARREAVRTVAERLLAPLRTPDGPFSSFEKEKILHLELIAKECAGFFQRSSSCVEGRNGQLSLGHHAHHKLDELTLQSLTVVHNFFIKRQDGTTAAERFFGRKPRDLFQHLLDRIELPARPAKRRHGPPQKPLLAVA